MWVFGEGANVAKIRSRIRQSGLSDLPHRAVVSRDHAMPRIPPVLSVEAAIRRTGCLSVDIRRVVGEGCLTTCPKRTRAASRRPVVMGLEAIQS